MAVDQFVGLHHAVALGDGELAVVEAALQHALGRLARGPGVVLLHRLVVDVADGDGALAADAAQHLAQLGGVGVGIPALRGGPVGLHVGQEVADVGRGHVAERVRPVFEHGLVGRLRLPEVAAPVAGDAAPQNVMMAALDDVDGVDLHVAQVRDRRGDGVRTRAEGRGPVEPLGREPQPACLPLGERDGVHWRFNGRIVSGRQHTCPSIEFEFGDKPTILPGRWHARAYRP